MAKRCEQMTARAVDREAGAKILTLKFLKSFSVALGDIRRVREIKADGTPGRVQKQVHLLRCSCRYAGQIKPVQMEIEMEAGDKSGVTGELEFVVLPAVTQFIKEVQKLYRAALVEKERPLDPEELPPLPGNRKPTAAERENARRLNAANQNRQKEETGTNGAEPPEQGGEA